MTLYESAVADLARLGGTIARGAFLSSTERDAKPKAGHFDIVTETDRRVEAELAARIAERFPSSRIWGEEDGIRGEGEHLWIIDPIDGTSNFASGLPIFATTLSVETEAGFLAGATYEPMRDDLYSCAGGVLRVNGAPFRWEDKPRRLSQGELLTNAPYEGSPLEGVELERFSFSLGAFRAVRRLGSCALHVAYVAAGRAAACYEYHFHPWDISCGMAFAAASGCTFLAADKDGAPIDDPRREIARVARILVFAPGLDIDPARFGFR